MKTMRMDITRANLKKVHETSRPYIRRALYTLMLLAIYVPMGHGFKGAPASFYTLLFGLCAIYWIPQRWMNSLVWTLVCTGSIAIVIWMHAKGAPIATGSSLLWAILVWLTLFADLDVLTAKVLYIILAIVILMTSHDGTFYLGVEALGIVALYFGIKSSRLRRIANAQLRAAHAQLEQAALQSIHQAAMEERLRIARDMHDGVGHELTSLIVQLQAASQAIAMNDNSIGVMNDQALQTARSALQELRSAVRNLEKPDASLTETAFRAVIRTFSETTELNVKTDFHPLLGTVDAKTKVALYRILQELLSNIARHAHAKNVTITVVVSSDSVEMSVVDDGTLQDVQTMTSGFGIRSITDRCVNLGGTARFQTHPPHGLMVHITVPYHRSEESLS